MLIKKSYQLIDYQFACSEMDVMKDQLKTSHHKSLIWFLEHSPVLTVGRSATEQDVPADIQIPVSLSNRGGKLTYHGPGQLVVYIVADLIELNLDIRQYLNILEDWITRVLKNFGIQSYASKERVGIWLQDVNTLQEQKIAAFGLRVSKGFATHGFSLNRNLDLSIYEHFTPCGLQSFGVSSLSRQNISLTFDEIVEHFLINCPKSLF
ncbi:MAG: octanoyltransferase [Candidatus Puniceispirillum sp.]|nr:octanoyltransferase [Candidatus Pelagibacter sp.]MBA4282702.1 octanoyltransferase [Candidatus Puniceispirillum sp.]